MLATLGAEILNVQGRWTRLETPAVNMRALRLRLFALVAADWRRSDLVQGDLTGGVGRHALRHASMSAMISPTRASAIEVARSPR